MCIIRSFKKQLPRGTTHFSLSCVCVPLQNTVLKTWQGKAENVPKAQEALLIRAKANSDAQKGVYDPGGCLQRMACYALCCLSL